MEHPFLSWLEKANLLIFYLRLFFFFLEFPIEHFFSLGNRGQIGYELQHKFALNK